jgi:hypothetical protein
MGERVRFQDFWNWLAQKYGGDIQASLHEQLRALRPANTGKLTLPAWREYESQFKLIFCRMENPSEEEAQALVLQQLPDSMRRAIIREQTRKNQDAPTVRLWHIPGLTAEKATQLAQEAVGEGEPVTVRAHRDSFLIKLYSRRALERLMMRNGATLQGGNTVKITPHETKLGLEEVFRHAENELRCQERSDSYGRSWGGRGVPAHQEDHWAGGLDNFSVSEVKSQEARPAQPQKTVSQPAEGGAKAGPPKGPEGPQDRQSRHRGGSPGKGREGRRSPSPGQKGKGFGKGAGKGGPDFRPARSPTPHPAANREQTPPRSPRSGPSVDQPCSQCGATDHWSRECPGKKCYECGKTGHLARYCWWRKGKGKGASTPPRRGSA